MNNNIMALDPGGTTGVCTSIDGGASIQDQYELRISEVGGVYPLWVSMCMFRPDIIVCERWDNRPKKGSVDVTAVECIGVVKLYQDISKCEKIVFQQQLKNKGNSIWTNDKLKKLGIYRANHEHAMDATRQLLHYVSVPEILDTYWVEKLRGE